MKKRVPGIALGLDPLLYAFLQPVCDDRIAEDTFLENRVRRCSNRFETGVADNIFLIQVREQRDK